MSFTYSGDPASSTKDWCRFMVGDTILDEPIMQDEEIEYLVDTYGANQNTLLYQLYLRAATLFARDIKRSLGPQSEDPTERLKFFRDQATVYKAKMMAGGISVPVYAHPKVFHRGMQNNPPVQRGDE